MFIKRLIAGTKQLASNEINPFIEKTLWNDFSFCSHESDTHLKIIYKNQSFFHCI